jgi:hypothetical protein
VSANGTAGDLLADFPDVELLGPTLLAELGAPVGTKTPAWLGAPEEPDAVPDYVRFLRVGGADDGVTDYPIVEVTTYAATRARSQALTSAARRRILAAAATVVDGVLLDRTGTYAGPLENPDQNPDVRAVRTSYVIEYRRPR